jgi:hypothetical protein
MAITDLDPVPGRECGACTACCTVMAIDKPDIQKEAGITCRHCHGGCAIYATRPHVCQTFLCGWRQLPILDERWRPDLSGVFVEIEDGEETAISLILIGNPLKTVRQDWFLDFVITGVKGDVPLSLAIPGPPGFKGAAVTLTTRQMFDAAQLSRARVKELIEKDLKRLQTHPFEPRLFQHRGKNFGTRADEGSSS